MSLKQVKTYSPKLSEATHDWYVVDAAGETLGRLATEIATLLIGKHKPQYAAHINVGDNVVVINAAQITVTGRKLEQKKYYHHSGYPGGIKEVGLDKLMATHPEQVIEKAVAGMLPKNRLSTDRLLRLKVYPGAEHPHGPQQPVIWKRGQ